MLSGPAAIPSGPLPTSISSTTSPTSIVTDAAGTAGIDPRDAVDGAVGDPDRAQARGDAVGPGAGRDRLADGPLGGRIDLGHRAGDGVGRPNAPPLLVVGDALRLVEAGDRPADGPVAAIEAHHFALAAERDPDRIGARRLTLGRRAE
jgi:hypothetical protein